MHVACVLIDHFPFKLEASRDPRLANRQVIVFQRSGARRTVLDVSAGSEHVTPGMPLQEALARCKDAVLVEADIAYYQRVFGRILVRLGGVSPVVDATDLGCAYVGLDGLEKMYGGQARLVDALLQAVPHNLGPRLGVSLGRFPAYLAATCAEPGAAYKTPAKLKDFLAPFPVDVLPVPWKVKAGLHSFGLDTLGQIVSRPMGPIQAQFGTVGATAWRLAHGIDDTPLTPLRPEPEVSASLVFPMPTATLEPLLTAIETLLSRIFSKPEMRGRFARTALLEGHILNRPSWERRFIFKAPAGDKSSAYSVFKGTLEDLSLPGPFEEVRLTLKDLTGEVGRQESLFQDVRRRRTAQGDNNAAHSIPGAQPDVSGAGDGAVVKDSRTTKGTGGIRALSQPTRLAVKADEDGIPAAVKLNSQWVEVESITDRWRIDDEWWRGNSVSRMYYACLIGQGLRMTVYQDLVSGGWYSQRV